MDFVNVSTLPPIASPLLGVVLDEPKEHDPLIDTTRVDTTVKENVLCMR